MSDTILVAIITLIASIGSVSISQIIKNKHELQLKSIEIEKLRRTEEAKALNSFIDVTLEHSNIIDFYKSLNKLVPFIDELSAEYLEDILKAIEDNESSEVINRKLFYLTSFFNVKNNIKSIK